MEPGEPSDPTAIGDGVAEFLDELIEEGADINGEPTPIAPDLWALHGDIAYEGETLLAEFDSLEEARSMLERVKDPDRPEKDR
jgi:hypothetical protein